MLMTSTRMALARARAWGSEIRVPVDPHLAGGQVDLLITSTASVAGFIQHALDRATAEDGRPRWVAGALGPTNRTASMSADVANPAAREVTFAQLVEAYTDQARGLLDGGADAVIVET